MGTQFKWSDSDKQKLLACTTPKEMTRAFPNKTLANLMRRQTEFKSEQNGSGNGHKSNGHKSNGHTPVQDLAYTWNDVEIKPLPETYVSLLTHNKVLKRLDEANNRKAIFVHTLRNAVFEAVEGLRATPPAPRTIIEKGYLPKEEIALLDTGDWQLGATRPTYNSEICETRIKLMADKVKEIIGIQRHHHPVNEIHIRLMGDCVENEGIYSGQSYQIDASLYKQMFDGVRILSNLILDLSTFVDRIHVVGVVVNHGQIRLASGASDPETNMDRLLYQMSRMVLDGPNGNPNEDLRNRITWDIPDGKGESNWYAIDHVFDWNHLLLHGDQIKGGGASGFPWTGVRSKTWGWIDSIDEPWDQMHFGHWHTPARGMLNNRLIIANPSTESSNTYAQEKLAAMGYPSQWLGFASEKHELTSEYWLNLSEKDSISKVPAKLRYR